MMNCSSISHIKMNENERKYFGDEDVEHGFIQVVHFTPVPIFLKQYNILMSCYMS